MSSIQPFLRSSSVAKHPGQDTQLSPIDLASDAKNFMRRVLQDTEFLASPPEPPARPNRNYELAFRLLEDAAMALGSMHDRQEQLEASVSALQARANLKIDAAEERVKEWQAFAVVLKTRLQDAEERLAAMQERAQAAEAQVNAERARAAAAEQWQSDEGALSRSFHDRIVSMFGNGSRAHSVLCGGRERHTAAARVRLRLLNIGFGPR